MPTSRSLRMSKKAALAAIALVAALGFLLYPNVYAWDSSPQITASLDASGNTVLTIQFSFAQMSAPPTETHHPIAFQVRTSVDGSTWTELAPVQISPWPTTTVFTETINIGTVSGTVQAQARLQCIIHGWSDWGPDPSVPVPEFPLPMIAATSTLVLAIGLLLLRRRNPVTTVSR